MVNTRADVYRPGVVNIRRLLHGESAIFPAARTRSEPTTQEMELLHTITHPSRIHDIRFTKRATGEGELLLVAAEDKKVTIYDVPAHADQPPSVIAELVGHENRVKAVDTLSIALPPIPDINADAKTSTTLATTISSDGKIRVYDLADVPTGPPSPNARPQLTSIAEYDTKGTRLTCMSMADGEAVHASSMGVNGKRKRTIEDDGGEDDEGAEENDEDDEDAKTGEEDDEVEQEDEEEEEEEEEAEEDDD